jgi:hypothetical protein
MIAFILKLVAKYLLPRHRFKTGDLVFKDGTRTLYEVDTNYYNTDLQPVTVVRPYPVGTQVFGIDQYDIKEFREYRKPVSQYTNTTASDVGISAHDNTNFGKPIK